MSNRVEPFVAQQRWRTYLLATFALACFAMITRTVISGGSVLAIGCVLVALFLIGSDFVGSRHAEAALKEANELLEARVLERTRALGRSEARLGGIVASAMDAIISVNREQRIVLFNVAAERLFGCSAAAALGQDLGQFIPHRLREQHRQHVEGFGATGVTSRSMRSLRPLIALRADGTECPIEASISQVEVAEEKIFTVILRDISERKRAEDAAALLAAVVASSSDAIVSKDLSGNITSWNVGAQRMFGYPAAEIVGRSITVLIPTELQAEEERILARVRSGEGVDHFETVRLRKDGSSIQVSITVSPIANANGQIVGASHVARDITERRSAEARALWLSSFPERNPSPILEIDPVQNVVHYANPAALRQFPTLPGDGLGHPLLTGVPALAERLTEQGTVHRELSIGDASFSQLLTNIADTGRVRIYSTDITDRTNAEREVHRLNADLERRVVERTNQLEAANKELEAFAYSVSHDLRAPLRAVSGFSRIVLEDYGPQLPEEARRHLQSIENGAQRMGTLIDELLVFARLSRLPLNKQSVDLAQQARDALTELESERVGGALELRIGDLPPGLGDPTLLKQVWMNLLSNALKYSKNRDPARIEVGWAAERDQIVYFVRDNGVGFDMRYADKLFGVFQRLHRQEEFAGTGVGLAIVHRIVSRHGGRVWADALPNQGATFHFTLPRA